MNKADRIKIFEMFGGKCAYCGCKLTKGWHVDEIEPIRRKYKKVNGHYELPDGSYVHHNSFTEKQWIERGIKWVGDKIVSDGCEHPERLCLENQYPACASCNINKHSDSLEGFRTSIKKYVESLNLYSVQYKIAKRFGLITETGNEVVFYFEKFTNDQNPEWSVATEDPQSDTDWKQRPKGINEYWIEKIMDLLKIYDPKLLLEYLEDAAQKIGREGEVKAPG